MKKIVVHHTAVIQHDINRLFSSINTNHKARLHKTKNGFDNHIAYHYIIGVDGYVLPTRPLDEVGFHASNLKVNKESIGICLSGNFDAHNPSEAQYKALIELIEKLRKKYGPLTLHGHNEFAKKTCPGKYFDFSQLTNIIIMFYENLYKDSMKDVKEENRIIKDPKGAIERISKLNEQEKFSELVYLMCFGLEKMKGNIK